MPGAAAMRAAVEAYVTAYNASDLDRLVALFAADARVEDPVGTPVRSGHAAIRDFFAVGIASGARLQLDGPIRTSANYAAFAFHVLLEWDGADTRIDVIDTFAFDESGKIAEMRAFFGADNMFTVSGE